MKKSFRDRRLKNHQMLHLKEIKGQKCKSKCPLLLRDRTRAISSTCSKVFVQTQTFKSGRWKNYCFRQSSENKKFSSLALSRSKTSSLLLDRSQTSERKNNLEIMRKKKPSDGSIQGNRGLKKNLIRLTLSCDPKRYNLTQLLKTKVMPKQMLKIDSRHIAEGSKYEILEVIQGVTIKQYLPYSLRFFINLRLNSNS